VLLRLLAVPAACLILILPVRGAAQSAGGVGFTRRAEPNERAFTVLVPIGWILRGGIYRVSPLEAGGPLNSMEAKCDLVVARDAPGSVAFRILPDVVYAHPGIGGGFFPEGGSYQGAVVRRLVPATDYLRDLAARLHPQARDLRLLEIRALPGEKDAMDRGMAFTNRLLAGIGGAGFAFQSDAAGATVEYTEGGVRYREALLAGVVDMRAAQTWKNTRTLAFRAPADEWDRWRAVADVIRSSVRFTPEWVLRESEGQRDRADIAIRVFDEMRRIDGEILRRTAVNRSEIMNDNFLVLTGQEEFVNPFTGEIEIDTGEYRYRWESPGGDRYYSNRESDDPNRILQRADFKPTPVRPRRNEEP
jgi:hypothetical protein